MRRLTTRERRSVFGTGFILALAALYLVIIEPRVLAWRELFNERENAIEKYRKHSLLIQNEEIIRDRFALIDKTTTDPKKNAQNGLDFYEQLCTSTSQKSFELRDIRPFTPRQKPKEKERIYGATLLGEGNMDGFEKYLLHLIHMEESLCIENLLLSIPRKDAPLQVTITVSRETGGL